MFGPVLLEFGGSVFDDRTRSFFLADVFIAAVLMWITRPSGSLSLKLLPVVIAGLVMRVVIPSIGFGLLMWFSSYHGTMEYLRLRDKAVAAEEQISRVPPLGTKQKIS